MFVLDASVTLSWCFEDESNDPTQAVLTKLENESAIVPSLWSLEVGNTLRNAEKKKRITKEKRQAFITLLKDFNIHTDYATADIAFTTIYRLSQRYDLTTYDASYLELAMREVVPLASKDHALLAAAKACNIPTLGH